MDKMLTQRSVLHYDFKSYSVFLIVATCFLALLVNLSQFITLGRFPAIFYQVMGHSKTILVLLGGYVFFREPINERKGIGMVVAVLGGLWGWKGRFCW